MKHTNSRPIQRSLLLGCLVFLLVVALALSLLTWWMFSSALYTRYQRSLSYILNYVNQHVDADELQKCIETRASSAHSDEVQTLLNGMVDTFSLSYLYLCIPDPKAETMYGVISATSAEEFAAGEIDDPVMTAFTGEYTAEELQRYADAWDAEDIVYLEEDSDFGTFYTAILPLRNSAGRTVALICADIPIEGLHERVQRYVLFTVMLILAIGGITGFILMNWLRRNVTGPVQALEQSAHRFATQSHGVQNVESLRFDPPPIDTGNELESLCKAISKMAEDMKRYVAGIVSAEARAASAEQEAIGISKIAYQDALTRVKSKAAYNNKLAELAAEIDKGAAKFAMVMVDLNGLKRINDTHGHERGDEYLVGACKIVSTVYTHSPVYRIGGDEFVAILTGRDYEARDALLAQVREEFRDAAGDRSRPAWERYSAAAGMAVFVPGDTVDQVFQRADEAMYRDKQGIRNQGSVIRE